MRFGYAVLAVLMLASLAGCGATAQPVSQATPVPQPTAVPASPTAQPPTAVPTAVGPTTTLTIEETEIVADSVDKPGHFEFKDRIQAATLERRKAWREPSFEQRAERANQVLAPFGYRLAATPESGTKPAGYELYKDEELVLADIAFFHRPQVSADGKDLVMLAELMADMPYLVRPAGGTTWDPAQHAFIAPILVGNQLVSVASPDMIQFDVMVGDEVVYSAGPFQPGPANPAKGLDAWDGRWVFELDGQAIVDGEVLNQELGYDEIFDWATVKGQPFYFFSKEGRVGVSYAGQVLPDQYDAVAHYECCEPSMFNPQANEDMVWFYALRDGTWYYVEMGVYE